MEGDHKIAQISSHVTGSKGLASLGGALVLAQGDNTKIATNAFLAMWREDHGANGAIDGRSHHRAGCAQPPDMCTRDPDYLRSAVARFAMS